MTGNPHISWENLWFPVDFPLGQPIDATNFLNVLKDSPADHHLFEFIFSNLSRADGPGNKAKGGILVGRSRGFALHALYPSIIWL